MALIYPTIWEQGDKREQLTPGYHYKKHVQSLVVPEGQVVTFYEREDRTGKKSLPMNQGTYHHLYFYGVDDKPGVIHVEKNGLSTLDLVEIGWNATYDEAAAKRTNGKEGRYPMYYSIPIGDRRAGEDFPNDKMQWLCIPFGVTVEVFDQMDFKGGSLIFSGNTQGEKERVNLWDYKFKSGTASWKTSSMRVRADEWESAGIAIEDMNIESDDDKKIVVRTELANNSPHKAEVGKEITWAKEKSVEENWAIEAGVTTSAGVEAGPEVCKVSGGIEVSISGGYGEVKSSGESKEVTDVVSAEVDGFGKVVISTIIEYGKMTGTAVHKWRNKRNNVIIEQRGKISASWSNDAKHEVH